MYSLNDYNYTLPQELIAQAPAIPRDESGLMVLDRATRAVSHHRFSEIAGLLCSGDLLVVNNTRVIPARLMGRKETGGKVEALLLNYPAIHAGPRGKTVDDDTSGGKFSGSFVCQSLVKSSKGLRPGAILCFGKELEATVMGGAEGIYDLEFRFNGDFDTLLEGIGRIPLPPYIEREQGSCPPCDDRLCYQTVYAEKKGAVAAPTAGLHFSPGLLNALTGKGVQIVSVTLHVGYGTFMPVRVEDVRLHRMHPEWYELTPHTADTINRARDEGRRVVAVGTTVVRVLEFAAQHDGLVRAGSGECDLFICPGFEYRVVDALATNFHLPKTTLLMLVSAFAGREFILDAYQEAVRRRYRFYSYGDAMLIV